MILGISGSPRKMATEHILGEALKMLEEKGYQTELFTVRGKSLSPCKHCDYCLKNKECIVKDDMYQLYPLIREAEGFVCLLYTSPSPRDGLLSRMPSSA